MLVLALQFSKGGAGRPDASNWTDAARAERPRRSTRKRLPQNGTVIVRLTGPRWCRPHEADGVEGLREAE